MDKTNLEIEFKTLLSLADYQALLPLFQNVPLVKQTNHYIDSPDFQLRTNRCSLRIRTFVEQAELTLKIPQEIGNLEINQVLELKEAKRLLENFQLPDGPVKACLEQKHLNHLPLSVWGSLTTQRKEMESDIGLMALDKNTYGDQIDFELELEVHQASKGEKDFQDFLAKHDIPFRYAQSKVARTAKNLLSAK
ncbi:TPA: CYTH domain-containing protein [Streptococcus suis]|uniref:CYTH domain-containing protein n=1 Tax=Streptococcus suivaginalis TaxID=3028082 RepID=A0AA96VCH8_9STRE|nr:CYTH domain-containing protein [Streptococcus sp. 29896]MBM7314246.1 CYTH domain-containing protein [Streptococcus suis]MCK4027617.1 CYTH domain-containing protein [Streptococcus suis]WNY46243.1 CYTH domain-containing protein [Streptococcus sp. 29896]HEL1586505.1 CYTH domain-containing protein [Streptococcus suis]